MVLATTFGVLIEKEDQWAGAGREIRPPLAKPVGGVALSTATGRLCQSEARGISACFANVLALRRDSSFVGMTHRHPVTALSPPGRRNRVADTPERR